MKQTEQQIHISIVQALRWECPGAVITHCRNEGNRGGRKGAMDGYRGKQMGVRAGFPDLVVFWKGRVIFIEVKREGSYLEKAQKNCRDDLGENGFSEYLVARSIDDIKEYLAETPDVQDIEHRGVIT